MKNIWLMICVALAVTLLVGCTADEPVEPQPKPEAPVLTIADREVEATAEGGRYTVNYTLQNPKEGAKLLVTPEYDWVRNVSLDVEGEISFEVAKSYEADARTCRVDVSYPGVYPNATIVVRQEKGLEHSISFVLQEVNATNIIMDVIPKDPKLSYVFILGNGNYIDENGLMEDDEALWASDMEIFQGFANAFGVDVSAAVTVFMYEGVMYGHRFNGVSPNTKYVAYAYGFDVATMTPTTEVCRMVINTKSVTDYVVDFNLSAEVDGPYVELEVKAVNYDGPFFFGLFDAKSCPEDMPDDEFRSYCSAAWEEQKGLYSTFFDTPEQGLHFIFNELAYYDKATWEGELDANTDYVLWAFGMDSEALINSTPVRHYFRTGNVAASSNVFKLSVEELHPRKATVKVETTTNDPYVAMLVKAERYESNTDDEIIEYILSNYNVNYATGTQTDTATGLTPSTDYELLVFGAHAGAPTTGLSRLKFTTPEVVYADLDITIKVAGYYDISELIAVDSTWARYEGEDTAVIVNVDVDSDAVAYYYNTVYSADYEFYEYETLVAGLVYEGAAKSDVGIFVLEYGVPFTFFGIAEDENGNYTEMYYSKPTTFTFEGRNDVSEYTASHASKSSLVYADKAPAKAADVVLF